MGKIMLVITYTLMLIAIGYFIVAIYVLSGGWAVIGGLILVIVLVFWNDATKGKI